MHPHLTIRELTNPAEIEHIAESVLRDLPEWFGRENSLLEYVENSVKHPFYVAYIGDEATFDRGDDTKAGDKVGSGNHTELGNATESDSNTKIAGFLSLDLSNGVTAEIYVMGVYKAFQGSGVGTLLVAHAKEVLLQRGFTYLLVKTVGESSSDTNYAKTRRFYHRAGFLPVQEIPNVWGSDNPCLLMIQSVQS